MSKKNYVDEHGNYHNIQNLTLAQIYLSGFDDGYMIAKEGKDERPQGEWILKATDYDAGGNIYECTNCHYCDVHAKHEEVPFCWHCGAHMKGGTEK